MGKVAVLRAPTVSEDRIDKARDKLLDASSKRFVAVVVVGVNENLEFSCTASGLTPAIASVLRQGLSEFDERLALIEDGQDPRIKFDDVTVVQQLR